MFIFQVFDYSFIHSNQVLGRVGPFPLILLPQFGGYWIEGTNHEPKEPPEIDKLPCPTSHFKLETNSTAKIYRKHFVGKVRRHGKCLSKYTFVWLFWQILLGWIHYIIKTELGKMK